MKKRILLLCLTLLTALLFAGCGMRTVQEMYALPKRSEEFSQLQSVIDAAMVGKTYSAPLSGENQQTVQMADLDGDGVEEYLIFASDSSDKPLKVLIFAQSGDSVRLVETIESSGAAFEQVEYVPFDDKPGCEMVIGRQVSDQVLRRLTVYTYHNGSAEQMLLVGYTKFLTSDLDENGYSEVMVLRPGEAETQRGMAMLYSCHNGQIERSVETELSEDTSHIRRITQGRLQCGTPAVFVASSVDDSAIVTDIFALDEEERFTNITFSSEADTSIRTLRNHYVYAADIDEDGILELPGSITMRALSDFQVDEQNFLLRWFSVDADGWEMDKMFTYHNFVGGWYMVLDISWATRAMVEERNGVYGFYVWDPEFQQASLVFKVYEFTGSTRDEDAVADGRFALNRTESVAYAAKLENTASQYGINEESLIENFRLIRQDWRADEK